MSAFGCNDSRSVKSLASRSEPTIRSSCAACADGERNGTVPTRRSPAPMSCATVTARDASAARADAAVALMNSRRSINGGRAKVPRRDYSLSRVVTHKTRDVSLRAVVTAVAVVVVGHAAAYAITGDALQTRPAVQERALAEI